MRQLSRSTRRQRRSPYLVVVDRGVSLGGGDRRVPKQHLHRQQIAGSPVRPGSESVAQGVCGPVIGQRAGHQLPHPPRRQGPSSSPGNSHPSARAIAAERSSPTGTARRLPLAVDQEVGAGRPAGEVAAMHAGYLGAA